MKLRSITREGFVWLAVELDSGAIIFLHRSARVGDCHRHGQKLFGS